MKKKYTMAAMLLLLTACSQESESLTESSNTGESSSNSVVGEFFAMETKEFPNLDGIPVDINFKELSTTVAFSMANLMMIEPQNYWDKSIRIDGQYMFMDTPEFGDVHLVLIMDETNCCQGFMEFELPSGATYPQDGDYIGLIGVFSYEVTPELSYSILKVDQFAY